MSVIVRDMADDERSAFLPIVMDGWSEYAPSVADSVWETMRSSLSAAAASMVAAASTVAAARIFVAELDGRLVGVVAYYGPGHSDGIIFPPEWASVRLLSVIQSARGLGIGRLLMERCVDAARRDGAAIIGLHTEERMVVARGLYDRMGFVVDMDLPPKYDMSRWRFRLELAQEGAGAGAD